MTSERGAVCDGSNDTCMELRGTILAIFRALLRWPLHLPIREGRTQALAARSPCLSMSPTNNNSNNSNYDTVQG